MEGRRGVLTKPECFVFKIPPRASASGGVRAENWDLSNPIWKGALKVSYQAELAIVELYNPNNEEVFATVFQHVDEVTESVEATLDSSRYYVLKITNEAGQHAFIGMGFTERSDSFDFKVALQDHKRRILQEREFRNRPREEIKLDLGLKEGQTIRVNTSNLLTGKKIDFPSNDTNDDDDDFLMPPPPSYKKPSGGKGASAAPSSSSSNPSGSFLL